MDPSLLDLNPALPPQGAAGPDAPAGLPPMGAPVAQYVPDAPPQAPVGGPPMGYDPTALAPQQMAPVMPRPTAPVMPPPQTKNVTDRESTTTTSRSIVDPAERMSYIQGQAANARLGELANEEGGINAEAARQKAEGEARKAQVLQQHGSKLQEIAQNADRHIAERDQAYRAADDAWKNATPRDFWKYDDEGKQRSEAEIAKKKFYAGIALALGGFTEREEGRNTAFEMIKSGIERRDQLEQQRIAKLKDVRDSIGKEREWELTKKHEAQADAVAWKQNAYDLAAQQIDAGVAQLGPGAERVKAMKTAELLRKEGAVTASQYFNDTKTEVRNQVVTKTQQIVGQGLNGPGMNGGRAAGKMMEYALMGTSIRDSLKQALSAAPPSAKVLAQLQDNDKTIKALNESHGAFGALTSAIARKTGAAPRSRFKGVPQSAQEQILGHEIAVDKVAEVLGSDKDSKENIRSILAWAPDDSLETKLKKNEMLKEYAQKAINLSQQYAGVADTGVPGVQAQRSSAPAETQQPRRFRKADGTTGMLYPDGTFEPDPGQEAPANKKRAIAERLVAARGGR